MSGLTGTAYKDINFQTDCLEVEVLEMPQVDLSSSFMMRICKPVAQVLMPAIYKVSSSVLINNEKDKILKSLILQAWKKQIEETKVYMFNTEVEKTIVEAWDNITEVKLHKVKLVREDDCKYKGLPIQHIDRAKK